MTQQEQIEAAQLALKNFIESLPPERRAQAEQFQRRLEGATSHTGGLMGVIQDEINGLRGQLLGAVTDLQAETVAVYTQVVLDDIRYKK